MTDIFDLVLWFALVGSGALGVLVWRRWLASEEHRQQSEARQRQRLEAAMRLSGPPAAPGYPHRRVSK